MPFHVYHITNTNGETLFYGMVLFVSQQNTLAHTLVPKLTRAVVGSARGAALCTAALLHLLELFALPTRVGFVVCQVQLILCLGALRAFCSHSIGSVICAVHYAHISAISASAELARA